jgi:hypothetical protein
VLEHAHNIFLLSKPHDQIHRYLLPLSAEKRSDIFLQFPGDLTREKILVWFSGIESYFPGSITAVEDIKNKILALFHQDSLQDNLDNVLKEFTADHSEDEVIGQGQGIPDQMDTGFIYVRPCYLSLCHKIFTEGLKGPVMICGDPGIGKSYFGLYVFCRLTGASNKAIRFTLSGDWISFNGESYQIGHDWSNAIWRDKDTWLLLDGNERLDMLSKRSRVVLFASPQKQNYHHFMKQTNAVCYYMPEWSMTELESLVRHVQEKNLWDASPFNELVSRNNDLPVEHEKSPKTDNQNDQAANVERHENGLQSTELPNNNSLSKTLSEGKQSKKIVVDSDFTKQVLHIVKSRYLLIGGRIRDIFSSGVTTTMLKNKLQYAVRNLDFDELSSVLGLQIESNFPSIIYKIVPNENDYRLYEIKLCSDRCQQLIGKYMFDHRNRVRVELFYTFSRHEDTRGACGNLFESICFRALSCQTPFERREIVIPKGKKIVVERTSSPVSRASAPPAIPSEPDNGILQFNDLDIIVKQFDKKCEAIQILKKAYEDYKNCAINILLLPTFSSQELFDSLVLNVPKKILYLFQITVAKEHNFDQSKLIQWMNQIEQELCIDLHSLEFGFMVPQSLYASYGLEHILVKNEGVTDECKFSKSIGVISNLLNRNPKIKLTVVGVDVS